MIQVSGRSAVLLGLAATALALPASSAAAVTPPMLGEHIVPQTGLAAPAPGAQPVVMRAEPAATATPRATCGPGAHPEGAMQGRVPADAPADGYRCNLTELSHEGTAGGFKVERFVDKAGHECAYYDATLLFPTNAASATLSAQPTGTAVLDMSDPSKPVRTATLLTPAMQTPHESLLLNPKRGLLAAVMGNPAFNPGFVDIYDVNADCRHPALQSSLPVGLLGHESGFTQDGKTFYATSLSTGQVTAVDVTNPKVPVTLWVGMYRSHGLTLRDDGNRAYVAANTGLLILDTSQIQARKPNPQATEVSRLTWKELTIPQVALPVTIGGKPMLVEIDEYSTDDNGNVTSNGPRVGAARIIDISDEKAPKVISNIRLAVNQPENRAAIAGDPGAGLPVQGYAGHYCNVPQETDPGIVACSFIASGLRVFDIRDPYHPTELAYFVAPPTELGNGEVPGSRSNFAMSKPAFVPARGEIWYSDGNSGFYALRVANGVWPFDGASALGLPAAGRCASRRSFSIRLRVPKGQRLRSARVYVNGKRVRVLTGKRLRARIDLRGLAKRTVRVKIVATTKSGHRITETRRYLTCTRKR